MDKKIIFAVAGSGKTAHVIDQLTVNKRCLVLTYTTNNYRNLKTRIIEKFGHFPDSIHLQTYFNFLYTFCYSPLLSRKLKAKHISWGTPPAKSRYKGHQIKYYVDSNNSLYHNRIAKLLETQKVLDELISRLEKYFDIILIDEIQDFAGHDFNFIEHISKSKLNQIFVGDFYQHTFDTSRDGNVNNNLHSDYEKYKARFKKMGFTADSTGLNKSHRCSPTLCDFISNSLGVSIESHRNDVTDVRMIKSEEEAEQIINCFNTVKLFYQEHYKYDCYSRNWGEVKGDDHYEDVCVVLNKTTLEHFENETLEQLNPKTKNKLYVACSRARKNLLFVSYKVLKKATR